MFECYEDFENFVSSRISRLRSQRNTSARNMSLTLGQGPAYINNIENKNSMPSMKGFYYTCEFFNISPKDFFDEDVKSPGVFSELIDECRALDEQALLSLLSVVKTMKK